MQLSSATTKQPHPHHHKQTPQEHPSQPPATTTYPLSIPHSEHPPTAHPSTVCPPPAHLAQQPETLFTITTTRSSAVLPQINKSILRYRQHCSSPTLQSPCSRRQLQQPLHPSMHLLLLRVLPIHKNALCVSPQNTRKSRRLSGSSPPSSQSHPLHRSAASHASSATPQRSFNFCNVAPFSLRKRTVSWLPRTVSAAPGADKASPSQHLRQPHPSERHAEKHPATPHTTENRKAYPTPYHTIANHPPANDTLSSHPD